MRGHPGATCRHLLQHLPARPRSTPDHTHLHTHLQVVHTVDASTIDKQAVYCRCWRSKTFPLCDASHVEHNKACPGGDNVGPLIVKAP